LFRSTKTIGILALVAYAVIILLPPIVHGYIYPCMGDDSALHLNIIKNGDLWNQLYYAYAVVGYPIRWLSGITGISINELFLGFSYISLVGVGWSFYFVLSRLVNREAGYLSLVLPSFVSLGLWWQLDDGMTFNIISIGVILPWLTYFMVRWLTQRKFYQLIVLFVLGMLYSFFHSTGIYLAPTLGVLLLGYLIHKRTLVDKKVVMVLVGLIGLNLLGTYSLYAHTQDILPQAISKSFGGKLFPLFYYIQGISVAVLVVGGYSLFILRKVKSVSVEIRLLLWGLGVLISLLLIASLGVSCSPDRQIFDMVTLVSLSACICVGVVFSIP